MKAATAELVGELCKDRGRWMLSRAARSYAFAANELIELLTATNVLLTS